MKKKSTRKGRTLKLRQSHLKQGNALGDEYLMAVKIQKDPLTLAGNIPGDCTFYEWAWALR